MKRERFLTTTARLVGLSLLSSHAVKGQFGVSSAAVIAVLQRIFTQVFNSKEVLTNLLKHSEDLVTNTDTIVQYLELKGWFSKIAYYNDELGRIAYGLKQLINVYNLAKEFEGQVANIETASKHYIAAFNIAVKALSPYTRITIKERIDLLKEADKEIAEGRKIIKQVESLIANRVDQIRRLEKYYKTGKKHF